MAMDKGLGKKGQGAWQRGKEAGALERGPVPGRHVSRKGQWGGGGVSPPEGGVGRVRM